MFSNLSESYIPSFVQLHCSLLLPEHSSRIRRLSLFLGWSRLPRYSIPGDSGALQFLDNSLIFFPNSQLLSRSTIDGINFDEVSDSLSRRMCRFCQLLRYGGQSNRSPAIRCNLEVLGAKDRLRIPSIRR